MKLKKKDCDCFLEHTNSKDNLIEYECLFWNKNYQKKFDENFFFFKKKFLIHTNFLTMVSISLFYCCEKVFAHTNIWIIEINSMKFHYLENNIFTVI